jgi:predicted outer membrane repeat protein
MGRLRILLALVFALPVSLLGGCPQVDIEIDNPEGGGGSGGAGGVDGGSAGSVAEEGGFEDAAADAGTEDAAGVDAADGGPACTCLVEDDCCDGCLPKREAKSCPGDRIDCTTDLCREGACEHELRPGFCLIGGVCYADGEQRPDNACKHCDAKSSPGKWTNRRKGASCDDGDFCNGDDSCDDDGKCAHAGDPCDAGDVCHGDEQRCCTPGAYLDCNGDGDVTSYDSCDHEESVVDDCADVNGACRDGICGCAAGWAGESCDRCLRYVDWTTGNDNDDGDTWDDAKQTVQGGINAAAATGCEVWAAAATYRPTEDATGNSSPADNRTRTVHLEPGVDLYGGFAGTEIARAQRDVGQNPTVLSGDVGAAGVNTDNAYHVVTGSGGVVIDGFTIRDGRADGVSDHGRGAGMFNPGCGPTLVVSNCTFGDNAAVEGGGMYNRNASPRVVGCTFEDNTADNGGGGIRNSYSSPDVLDTEFRNNSANQGGAVNNLYASSALFRDCTFSGNTANAGAGGAVYGKSSFVVYRDCAFEENSAADFGGAMQIYKGEALVINSSFVNNAAENKGGAVSCSASSSTFINGVFHGNSAENGGAMRVLNDSTPTISNCSYYGNTASDSGGALYIYSGTSVTINNSIFWGDSPDEIDDHTGDTSISYSTVGSGGYAGSDGNVNKDPLFANTVPANGDIDLHLSAGSPCIDSGSKSGSSASDMDGRARFDDPDTPNCDDTPHDPSECSWFVDMGAYEFNGAPSVSDPICMAPVERTETDHLYWSCTRRQIRWELAASHCRSMGGYLASVTDGAENAFLADRWKYAYWIGANDRAVEGDWVWESGEPWDYTSWAGEPSPAPNGGALENCAVFGGLYSVWFDDPCENNKSFICETDG